MGTGMKNGWKKSSNQLSDLPYEILQHIFSFLPIKNSVQTSILSKNCRCFWTSSRYLDFNDMVRDSLPNNFYDDDIDNRKVLQKGEFAAIVDRVMQFHDGPEIKRLWLEFCPGRQYSSNTSKWLKIAIEKDVEVVVLDCNSMFLERPFDLPKFIMKCKSISLLKLTSCSIKFPLMLQSLKTLDLEDVNIGDKLVLRLLSDCPQLESLWLIRCQSLEEPKFTAPSSRLKSLTVVDCANMTSIWIDAPGLETLQVTLYAEPFHLINTAGLKDALLNFSGEKLNFVSGQAFNAPSYPRTVMSHLQHVRVLSLSGFVLQTLYAANYLPSPPITTSLYNLKELQVAKEIFSEWDHCAITWFFQMCPNLEKFFIELNFWEGYYGYNDYFEENSPFPQLKFSYMPPGLKTFKMNGFTGEYLEMWMVKFIMTRALSLNSVTLTVPDGDVDYIVENVFSSLKIPRDPNWHQLSCVAEILRILKPNEIKAEVQVLYSSKDCNNERATHGDVCRFDHLS